MALAVQKSSSICFDGQNLWFSSYFIDRKRYLLEGIQKKSIGWEIWFLDYFIGRSYLHLSIHDLYVDPK